MLELASHCNPALLQSVLSTMAAQDLERLLSHRQACSSITAYSMEPCSKRVCIQQQYFSQQAPPVPSPSNLSSTIGAYYPAHPRDVTPESAPNPAAATQLGHKRSLDQLLAQQQQQRPARTAQRRRLTVRTGRPPLPTSTAATSHLLSHILLTIAAPPSVRTPPGRPVALPQAALAHCRAPAGPHQVAQAAHDSYSTFSIGATWPPRGHYPRVHPVVPEQQMPTLLPSIWSGLMHWLPLLNLQSMSTIHLAGHMWHRLRRQVLEQGQQLYFTPAGLHGVSDSVLIGCLVVAIKLEECRKGAPSLSAVGRAAGASASVLGRLELQCLEALSWRPLLGYKPPSARIEAF